MAIFLNLVIPAEWGPETVKEIEEKMQQEKEAIRDGFIQNSVQDPLERI